MQGREGTDTCWRRKPNILTEYGPANGGSSGSLTASGIIAYAAPLSSKLVTLLADLDCPLFNVNSSDLNNPDMLDAVAD
jgi:hypothetical protein